MRRSCPELLQSAFIVSVVLTAKHAILLSRGALHPSKSIAVLQVYAFGPVSIIMDATQGIVRAHLQDKWVPVSLDQLVQEAATQRR